MAFRQRRCAWPGCTVTGLGPKHLFCSKHYEEAKAEGLTGETWASFLSREEDRERKRARRRPPSVVLPPDDIFALANGLDPKEAPAQTARRPKALHSLDRMDQVYSTLEWMGDETCDPDPSECCRQSHTGRLYPMVTYRKWRGEIPAERAVKVVHDGIRPPGLRGLSHDHDDGWPMLERFTPVGWPDWLLDFYHRNTQTLERDTSAYVWTCPIDRSDGDERAEYPKTLLYKPRERDEITAEEELLGAFLRDVLDDGERALIEARYFDERTQADIARAEGVSQAMICKRERKVIEKLRAAFRDAGYNLPASRPFTNDREALCMSQEPQGDHPLGVGLSAAFFVSEPVEADRAELAGVSF